MSLNRPREASLRRREPPQGACRRAPPQPLEKNWHAGNHPAAAPAAASRTRSRIRASSSITTRPPVLDVVSDTLSDAPIARAATETRDFPRHARIAPVLTRHCHCPGDIIRRVVTTAREGIERIARCDTAPRVRSRRLPRETREGVAARARESVERMTIECIEGTVGSGRARERLRERERR